MGMIGSTQIKFKVQSFLEPVARWFRYVGLTPNVITVSGFLFSLVSAALIVYGNLLLASVPYALSGLCDMLDGIAARVNGQGSRFGAFLDSFLDRYSDFFPFGAICFLSLARMDAYLLLFSLLSIVGSFSTSYARARAESLGVECRVGVIERPERFLIFLFLLISGYAVQVMFILAVLTNFTAFQRLLHVKRSLKG